MKNSYYIGLIIVLIATVSCEKRDRKPHVLASGDGVWQIEQIEYIYYDSLSYIDTTVLKTENLGELVFFDSHWGTQPTHFCKHIYEDEFGGIFAENLDFGTNGNRLDLLGSTGVGIEGLYSVDKWGRKNQKWVQLLNDGNNQNGLITVRKTVTVKKGTE